MPNITFILPHWIYWGGLIAVPVFFLLATKTKVQEERLSLPLAYFFWFVGIVFPFYLWLSRFDRRVQLIITIPPPFITIWHDFLMTVVYLLRRRRESNIKTPPLAAVKGAKAPLLSSFSRLRESTLLPFCYLRESANGDLSPKMANPCGGKAAGNFRRLWRR